MKQKLNRSKFLPIKTKSLEMGMTGPTGSPTQHGMGLSWHGLFRHGHTNGPPNVLLRWPKHGPRATESCRAVPVSTTSRASLQARGSWSGGQSGEAGRPQAGAPTTSDLVSPRASRSAMEAWSSAAVSAAPSGTHRSATCRRALLLRSTTA